MIGNGMVRPCSGPASRRSQKLDAAVAVIGIDIGKNSFHVVGLDRYGAIVLRQKWCRGQVATRLPLREAARIEVIQLLSRGLESCRLVLRHQGCPGPVHFS
jgi:hypothetical protein